MPFLAVLASFFRKFGAKIRVTDIAREAAA